MADPTADLRAPLAEAIAYTARRHDLKPGSSPSTTVNIVRWRTDSIDVLMLCDSPVVVDRSGNVHEVRDERLRHVNNALGRRPAGYQPDNPDHWRAFIARQQERRSRPGGYWVAEADPKAADHAVLASWPIDEITGELAIHDPARLIDVVNDAERSDPDGVRWPRSKRHDDKALAVVQFTTNGASRTQDPDDPKAHNDPREPATQPSRKQPDGRPAGGAGGAEARHRAAARRDLGGHGRPRGQRALRRQPRRIRGRRAVVGVQVAVPRGRPDAIAPFWSAATGWPVLGRDGTHVWHRDTTTPNGPYLDLRTNPDPKVAKLGLHLDVGPYPDGEQQAELDRLLAAGATLADIGQGPEATWHVLADPRATSSASSPPR